MKIRDQSEPVWVRLNQTEKKRPFKPGYDSGNDAYRWKEHKNIYRQGCHAIREATAFRMHQKIRLKLSLIQSDQTESD